MKADEILQAALNAMKERGSQNGYDHKEERSAGKIARMMNAKTGDNNTDVDAWRWLLTLKEARLENQIQNGSDPTDTVIDLVAYAALMGEAILAGRKTNE